jgi:hypothetical protein
MATPQGWPFHKEVRRCPTLPQGPPCSTIGAESLSFRVRNVTGRFPLAMAAETLLIYQSKQATALTCLSTKRCLSTKPSGDCRFSTVHREPHSGRVHHFNTSLNSVEHVLSSYRLISTGQLHGSLVPTSTSGLSTQWSSWEPLARRHGNLILKSASRLDAFSGYPFRT